MTIIVSKPTDIKEGFLQQIIDLIVIGGQIEQTGLREKMTRADLVSFKLDGDKIIATATLKNPYNSYRTRVFTVAKVGLASNDKYQKELGYIATHPDYEGKGHCTDLLKTFFPQISDQPIFATTRKPAMLKILKKFGFKQVGRSYKNDLRLLTYDPVGVQIKSNQS